MRRWFSGLLGISAVAVAMVLTLAAPALAIVYGQPDEG